MLALSVIGVAVLSQFGLPGEIGLRVRLEARESLEDDVPFTTDEVRGVYSTDLRPGVQLDIERPRYQVQVNDLLTLQFFDHDFRSSQVQNTLRGQVSGEVTERLAVEGRAESFVGASGSIVEILGVGGLVPVDEEANVHREDLSGGVRYELTPVWSARLRLGFSRRGFFNEEGSEEFNALDRTSLNSRAEVARAIPRGELRGTYEHLEVYSGFGQARNDSLLGGVEYELTRTVRATARAGMGVSRSEEGSAAILVGGARLVWTRPWGEASLHLSRRFAELEAFAPAASLNEAFARAEGVVTPRLVVTGQAGFSRSQALVGQEEQISVLAAEAGMRAKLVGDLWLTARYSVRQQQGSGLEEFDFSRNLVIVGLMTTFGAGHIARTGGVALGNF